MRPGQKDSARATARMNLSVVLCAVLLLVAAGIFLTMRWQCGSLLLPRPTDVDKDKTENIAYNAAVVTTKQKDLAQFYTRDLPVYAGGALALVGLVFLGLQFGKKPNAAASGTAAASGPMYCRRGGAGEQSGALPQDLGGDFDPQ